MSRAQSWHQVTDPQAAQFLIGWQGRPRSPIAPFLEGDCTVSQAAEMLGLSLSSAYRLVEKLLRLGLIVQVRETPKRGRPQKVYRAVAAGFFIPFRLTGGESVAAQWAQQDAELSGRMSGYITAALRHHAPELDDWGTTFTTDQVGRLRQDFGPSPLHATPFDWPDDVVSWWANLTLTPGQAAQLGRELQDLFQRYFETPPSGGSEAYFLRLALAPRA